MIDFSGKVDPCGDRRAGNIDFAEYDPYDPGFEEDECSELPPTSGGGGSGTQYQPGDYTHGETVDWHTGIGNGGYSDCGEDAKVEYVCIEFWDEAGQRWDVYACGFATTC